MHKPIDPDGIAPPASAYHHAFHVTKASEWLFLSGQLGETASGQCLAGADAQARQAWQNVAAILAEAAMDFSNIVKVTSYIVGEENIEPYVAVHRELHKDCLPPWTLVVVKALGHPEYLIEVDVQAAK
ncbi:MAG TPA: RidA family protein [Kiloniellaceae bacterium]|nr:RidA family protein [Kiloniellaceae bacterium]